MRVLITVPHFFRSGQQTIHGSVGGDSRLRVDALTQMLISIHRTFGSQHAILGSPAKHSNLGIGSTVDVVVCTSGNDHLVPQLPAGLFRHHATEANPIYLGFECHQVLLDAVGQYDFYCFSEDDIFFGDPLFFQKLTWFNSFAGPRRVLQPNRFEANDAHPREKLYVDGQLANPAFGEELQPPITQATLVGNTLGQDFVFERVNNPHSGCFFLNEEQFRHWVTQGPFPEPSNRFFGPLESAATLGVMQNFEVFKPAPANAAFLEVRHWDFRYLGPKYTVQKLLAKVTANPTPAMEPAKGQANGQ